MGGRLAGLAAAAPYLLLLGVVEGPCGVQHSLLCVVEQLRDVLQVLGRALGMERRQFHEQGQGQEVGNSGCLSQTSCASKHQGGAKQARGQEGQQARGKEGQRARRGRGSELGGRRSEPGSRRGRNLLLVALALLCLLHGPRANKGCIQSLQLQGSSGQMLKSTL